MKKRSISLILVICLLVCMLPTMTFASDSSEDRTKGTYYKNYTAVGDSICAGFKQADYGYKNGFDMTKNINNSPDFCYARLVGNKLGSNVYNLGKLGCDTGELLDILSNQNNKYYDVYRKYIGESDLLTLEIGSDDLVMSAMHSVLDCIGGDFSKMSTDEVMAMAEPLMTGNVSGIVDSIEKVKGITLSKEQIQAIQEALSDKSLSGTLEKAYNIFCDNYPKIIEKLHEINPRAELLLLNYYNPYKCMNFSWGDIKYNTGDVIQASTDKMNKFTLDYCKEKGYLYVDISDTQTNIVDPHPSTAGHAQIAHHIIDALLNTITASAQIGGTITPAGENIVKYGEAMTFSITADSGYEISDVLVDGKSIGAVKTYTFTDVKGAHSITANFRKAGGAMDYKTYTALGDSITAGYSLPDYSGDFSNPNDCYVADAAKEFGVVNNYNLALPAYTTKDLLNALTDPSNKYYTRFRNSLQASDLITVDIGSNDLTMTMLDIVLKCLGKNADNLTAEDRYAIIQPLLKGVTLEDLSKNPEKYLGQNITEAQKKAISDALKTENIDASFEKAYEKFTENWDKIIATIKEINPNATIVAIGYYNSNPDLHFEYNGTVYYIGKVYQKYIAMMNTYISEKCAADKYIYVDISAGIELNSTGCPGIFDPHPSKSGHLEIAARIVFAIYIKHGYKKVTAVSLNKTSDTLNVGDTDTLIATVTPADACNKKVIWSSSNTSVATVDSNGKVTAVSAGTAEIKVTTVDGNKTAACNVNVTTPAVNVTPVITNTTTTTASATITTAGTSISSLPKTGYMIDTETLILAGLVMIIIGMTTIWFRKKES